MLQKPGSKFRKGRPINRILPKQTVSLLKEAFNKTSIVVNYHTLHSKNL